MVVEVLVGVVVMVGIIVVVVVEAGSRNVE